ncbi:AAA family ATPase [Laspinema olomoucense]|uniref:AAA family ATPase n=1 Tax=Laspinema olomoucense TaxID=3231600 RepID=UPI0021BA9FAF|nr:AAA family ATPase [Laspinema sp. D3a]MCT7990616.1 AAA family ATPase [Laspinema sp. D3a]
MRIHKISVTNLFGIFNHTIPLNLDERITIIHGPNGFGKTILLRMLNGLFNSRYLELVTIPFSEFRVEFDNGEQLVVTQSIEKTSKAKKHPITLQLFDSGLSKKEEFQLIDVASDSNSFEQMSQVIESRIPETSPINYEISFNFSTHEILPVADVIRRFGEVLPKQLRQINTEPNWFINVKKSIALQLIEAQRLFNFSNVLSGGEDPRITSVAAYSEELAEHIQSKLAEYGELAQSLDRTFPARVVKTTAHPDLTGEKIHAKLREIEEKRYQLIEAGLLNQDEDPDFQVDRSIDDTAKSILSVYVEDVENKLRVFEELAQKIEILKRIINSRFCYKSISVNKEKGFIFQTDDGKQLSPENLSSGEQHQLVMLYELLFKAKPNSLILIDEPELSLHVAWQAHFLKDLQQIAKLVNIDVLIATHSPDIISDRWDLTVELKGP